MGSHFDLSLLYLLIFHTPTARFFLPRRWTLVVPLWGPTFISFCFISAPRKKILDAGGICSFLTPIFFYCDGWMDGWLMDGGSKKVLGFYSNYFQMKFRRYKYMEIWKICEKLFIRKKSNFNFQKGGVFWIKFRMGNWRFFWKFSAFGFIFLTSNRPFSS